MRKLWMFTAAALISTLLSAKPPVRLSEPQVWDPEKEVPPVTYIGPIQPEDLEMGKAFRDALVKNIRYWRDLGLPDPDDLEGLYAMSDLDTLRVVDVLQQMNPGIPNIRDHILAQREALEKSALAEVIRLLVKELKQEEKYPDPLDFAFDKYGMIRYGMQFSDLDGIIRADLTYGEVRAKDPDTINEHVDNAFFGRFPRVDLVDMLIPADPKSPIGSLKDVDPNSLFKPDALNKLSTDEKRSFVRRIVILPRRTEGPGDTAVNTMNDHSVGTHEQGHFILHFLTGDGNLDRMVDEVMADFLAAAPIGNPIIGEFFAKASGVIAERLNGSEDAELKKVAASLSRLAAEGFLRDMSTLESIDDLERVYSQSDDYDGGQPLRNFLWTARNSLGIPTAEFDQFVLSVVPEFTEQPMVASVYANTSVSIRGWKRQLKNMLLTYLTVKTIEAKLIDPQTKALLIEQAKVMAQKDLPPNLDETARRRAFNKLVKKHYEELAKVVYDAVAPDRQDEAKKKVLQAQAEKEKSKMNRRNSLAKFGVRSRPAIRSDYVIPEYFRAFYRLAAYRFPQKAAAIRELMEKTMNSRSVLVKSPSGEYDIVFAPGMLDAYNPLVRRRLSTLIERRERAQTEFSKLLATDLPEGAPEAEVQAFNKRMADAKLQYSTAIDGLQEFERTGRTFSLYMPHFWLRTAHKIGTGVVNLVSKKAVERKAKAEAYASSVQSQACQPLSQDGSQPKK